jgi:cytochrome P450
MLTPQSAGPIVRITPDEVHLSDPAHYDFVYGMKSGFYKDHRFYGALGIDVATFGSINNDVHRRRRAALNPFFSRKKVLELEDIVHDKADKLCRILHHDKEANKPTNIDAAFRAISVDVITDYAFGESWGQLDSPDLGAWFSEMVRGSSSMFFTLQAFPTLMFLHSLPPAVAKRMSPAVADFIGCQVVSMQGFCVMSIG